MKRYREVFRNSMLRLPRLVSSMAISKKKSEQPLSTQFDTNKDIISDFWAIKILFEHGFAGGTFRQAREEQKVQQNSFMRGEWKRERRDVRKHDTFPSAHFSFFLRNCIASSQPEVTYCVTQDCAKKSPALRAWSVFEMSAQWVMQTDICITTRLVMWR